MKSHSKLTRTTTLAYIYSIVAQPHIQLRDKHTFKKKCWKFIAHSTPEATYNYSSKKQSAMLIVKQVNALQLKRKKEKVNKKLPSGRKKRREGRPQGYRKPSEESFRNKSASLCGKLSGAWEWEEMEGKSFGVISRVWETNCCGFRVEFWLINRVIKEKLVRMRVLDDEDAIVSPRRNLSKP